LRVTRDKVLAAEFQSAAIEEVYLRILHELGIREDTFLKMIAETSALEAAKALLSPGSVQVGFRGLRRLGRTDLSVEHLVLQPKWRPLFSNDEIASAKQRLERHTVRKSKRRRPLHRCSAGPGCPLAFGS
jgi:hypothetical protein